MKKIFYNGADKWKKRASSIINELVDGGGGDFIQSIEKGQPDGVATLDHDGKVPASQLPEQKSYFSVVNGLLCITYEEA